MTPRHARHRMTLPLRRRIILPVLTLLAALALAAGLISGLSPASAAPAAAVTVLADRAAAFPAALAETAQDKTLIVRAVLRSRAQAAARAAAVLAAHPYTVRAGDSMSSVATRRCGTARDWTGIYAASRLHRWTARNANILTAGQHLYLSCAYLPSMLRYAPAPPPPRPVYRAVSTVSTASASSGTYHRSYSAPAASGSYGNVSASNYSGFQACVIARESGGNSQVMNSSSHYGLYQFSASTWQAYGGSASTFGHASVAEQNRVFGNAMARGGQSNWSPYDGC
jgi:Transglycosylase-like domain